MNLFEKIKLVTGLSSEKTENSNETKQYEISTDDSIDVIFAKTLIQNNGSFFYCDNEATLIQTIQALVKELKIDQMYCIEPILQTLLSKSKTSYSSNNPSCDAILSSCEYLIAQKAKIMLSSKQLGSNNIKNLPKNHIIIAYASQIVKSLNEGMSGINMRHIDNLPSTITTIKSKHKNNIDNLDGNIKNLSVILIEDFNS
jgi:L-lactate utilization protein LutC